MGWFPGARLLKPEDIDLDDTWETAHSVPRLNGRPFVYRLMYANFLWFGEKIATDFPGWEPLAVSLASKGVRRKNGSTYSGEALRLIWWRVRRARFKQIESGLLEPSPYDLDGAGSPVKRREKKKGWSRVPAKLPDDDAPPPPGVRIVEPGDAAVDDQIEQARAALKKSQPWLSGRE